MQKNLKKDLIFIVGEGAEKIQNGLVPQYGAAL